MNKHGKVSQFGCATEGIKITGWAPFALLQKCLRLFKQRLLRDNDTGELTG